MPYTPFLAGQRVTAGALDFALMAGVTVFRAYRAAAQSISSGAESVANALVWDAIGLDLLSGWSAGTPTRWTCPVAGWWTLSGSISINGNSGGSNRDAVWFVNGSIITAGRARTFAETSISATLAITVEARTLPVQLAVGDYVQLIPAHNIGAAEVTATGSAAPYMAVTYSGPA